MGLVGAALDGREDRRAGWAARAPCDLGAYAAISICSRSRAWLFQLH